VFIMWKKYILSQPLLYNTWVGYSLFNYTRRQSRYYIIEIDDIDIVKTVNDCHIVTSTHIPIILQSV